MTTEGVLPYIFGDSAHPVNSPRAMDDEAPKAPAEGRAKGRKRSDPDTTRPAKVWGPSEGQVVFSEDGDVNMPCRGGAGTQRPSRTYPRPWRRSGKSGNESSSYRQGLSGSRTRSMGSCCPSPRSRCAGGKKRARLKCT